MSDKRQETDYYEEIAKAAVDLIRDNLTNPDGFSVKSITREISQGLRTLIADGYEAGAPLRGFIEAIPKLWTDFSILVENRSNGKFEIVIFEVKLEKNLGLSELAQLIGYCLVSKCRFGILVNIGAGVSADFSSILKTHRDLTAIDRVIAGDIVRHEMGIMIWNSLTSNLEYTDMGAIKSVPDLVEKIEAALA